uniref:Uncharacterized protein n=1 Tax=Anguilla anguilla TaxID=7936 RepID=A0A0E9XD88_ANGAN
MFSTMRTGLMGLRSQSCWRR